MADPIPSPYQDLLDDLASDRSYFDYYDDLPASSAWMHTIGAALGKVFGIKVIPDSDNWEMDFAKKELRAGSIENVYTRRGVLGLLLNGIGRIAFGDNFPTTTKDAQAFATKHTVAPELAKHFGALVRIVDEARTDDKIAHEYAGGERVVETMHAQGYEGAGEQLRLMALDMRMRRAMARESLDTLDNLQRLVDAAGTLDPGDSSSKKAVAIEAAVTQHFKASQQPGAVTANSVVLYGSAWMHNEVLSNKLIQQATGRVQAVMLIALHPEKTDTIAKVLFRAYERNVSLFGNHLSYERIVASEEKELIEIAGRIHPDLKEIEALASHEGGHAQYVLAKAEQFYHGHTLGIPMQTPFFGYDMEARALDVEAANEAARELARAMINRGLTKDIPESIDFAKELLPIVEKFPFLDLNDQQKKESGGKSGNMTQRVMGAGKEQPPKQKRDKQRQQQSEADKSKNRRKMEGKDNKKNQEEVDKERGGYSVLGDINVDPLSKYLYIIGPYLGRISATAARMRRILKVNEPAGLRGAYRRGKAINPKIMYRHRLDDYKIFARREVEKKLNYGFVLMGDLSGSTEQRYSSKNNRMIEDEILASAFIITEIAERIGEKIMCAVGFFTSDADTTKRAGNYLDRTKIVTDIKSHGGGTNVQAAGMTIAEDLQEMADFKIKNKTVVFITDGGFSSSEFLTTVQAAKKHDAGIAYFQISDDVTYGNEMCKEVAKFTEANAKGLRIRTKNITTSMMSSLPELIAQLMKETVTAKA